MAVTDIPVTGADFKALLAAYGVDWARVAEPPFITMALGGPSDGEVFLIVTEFVHDKGKPFVPFLGQSRANGRRNKDRRSAVSDTQGFESLAGGHPIAKQTRWLPLRVVE